MVGVAPARFEYQYVGLESNRLDRRSIHPTDFDRDVLSDRRPDIV